jgi:hypothetical protein
MNTEIRRFLVILSLAAVVLVLAGFILFKWFLSSYYLPVYWLALGFFYLFTLATYIWQVKVAYKDMDRFSRLNMVSTLLRLLIYVAFTVVYLMLNPEQAAAFVVVILVLYITFTFLEVRSIAKVVRTLSHRKKK